MSNIHHMHRKQAEKMGVELTRTGQYEVRAFWPSRNFELFGVDAREALDKMEREQELIAANERGEPTTIIRVADDFEDKPSKIDGVPTDGRIAHQKGFAIVDNPLNEDDQEYEQWNEAWEESAEEATNAPVAEEEKVGSVVKTKYRAIYKERGHPAHCGDELAIKLNNLVLDGNHTNIEYFKMILDANDVDVSKLNTTSPGWQGRYRMTGRNMLAKRVFAAGGMLKLPSGEYFKMSADWLATQRFK